MRKVKTQIQERLYIFSHIPDHIKKLDRNGIAFSITITHHQLTQENETTVVGFITMSFLLHVLLLNSLYFVAEFKLHLQPKGHRNPGELVFSV